LIDAFWFAVYGIDEPDLLAKEGEAVERAIVFRPSAGVGGGDGGVIEKGVGLEGHVLGDYDYLFRFVPGERS
jgi:hypothetical protein